MPTASSIVVTQNAPVVLSATETTLFPANAPNGVGIPGAGPGKPGWAALAIITVPGVTNVPAGGVITVKVRAGTSSAAPEIGTVKWKNPTNQTDDVGVGSLAIPVPAGTQSVFVGLSASLGTPSAQATATEPIAFVLLGLTSPD
jgi:hypothetical protein